MLVQLSQAPEKVRETLDRMEPVRELGRLLKDEERVLFLGRHVGFPVALEGALKLKELAYVHAEGFAAGELKHGPIALVDAGPAGRRRGAAARTARCCTTRSSPTSRRSGPAARARS